jgi:hypothetical protein
MGLSSWPNYICEELSLLTYYTSAGRHTSLASTRVVIAFGFARLPSNHDRFASSDVISQRSPDLSFQTAWRALLDPTKPASISALLDLACPSDSCASHDATSQSKCDRNQSWPGPTALHAMPCTGERLHVDPYRARVLAVLDPDIDWQTRWPWLAGVGSLALKYVICVGAAGR